MYHPSVPLTRRGYAAIVLVLLIVGGFIALPYLDALGFIIRAADIPGTPATLANGRSPYTSRASRDHDSDASRRHSGAAVQT